MFRKLIRIILISAVVTGVILCAKGWSSYSETMQVAASCQTSETAQTITIQSRNDAVPISARYTQVNDALGTVILVHGLGNCKDDPRLVHTETTYQSMGYATLAIDMRAHGQSTVGPNLHGFGSLRADDILGAFDWLVETGIAKDDIILHGQSLGGSAVLFAALRENQITRVVAEAPILNFDRILTDGGAPTWFLPIFKGVGRLRGFDLSQQPVDVCAPEMAGRRILVVQSEDDPVTSYDQFAYLPVDGGLCQSRTLQGDWHIGWSLQQPENFQNVVQDFLEE